MVPIPTYTVTYTEKGLMNINGTYTYLYRYLYRKGAYLHPYITTCNHLEILFEVPEFQKYANYHQQEAQT